MADSVGELRKDAFEASPIPAEGLASRRLLKLIRIPIFFKLGFFCSFLNGRRRRR